MGDGACKRHAFIRIIVEVRITPQKKMPKNEGKKKENVKMRAETPKLLNYKNKNYFHHFFFLSKFNSGSQTNNNNKKNIKIHVSNVIVYNQ